MKRIGPVAAKLVRNPIELVAAANQKRSTQIEGGSEPSTRGEDRPDPLPRLNAEGSASNVNVVARKEASAETPASASREEVRVKLERKPTLDTPLTMSRNMDRGLPHTRRPSAPRSIFLVTVDGVCVHLPPAQAARSGSARATKNSMAQMTQSF